MSANTISAGILQEMLITQIQSGELLPGEVIPSERSLALRYGVSRQTVRNAIDQLVKQRYLIRIQGRGTFVKKPDYNKVAFGVLNESENASFTALVRNFGIEISSKVLGTGILEGHNYFAERLHLSVKDPIFGLHRIRYGNKEPLAIEYTYVPMRYFPEIQDYNFERVSLYDYMASQDHLPCNFRETMMMVEAGTKIVGYLQLGEERIVNRIEILGFDAEGRIVEYTESYSRPDKLEVRFVT
ncbi:MAG: GntR family transcriptional regulator [Eubacteriales bacterium]|nr:GntR family transcriptional regulator [Eubacteriales bacterium]